MKLTYEPPAVVGVDESSGPDELAVGVFRNHPNGFLELVTVLHGDEARRALEGSEG